MNTLHIGGIQLRPLTLADKACFDETFSRYNIPLSDYTFANNYIWLSTMSGFYADIEGCLCLFSLSGNRLTMLLPPLGAATDQRAALPRCFDLMDQFNHNPYLGRIDFVYRDFLDTLDSATDVPMPLIGSDKWLVERSNPDYIYRTTDLIELKGNSYKNKRNEINQFKRAFPDYRVEPFAAHHAAVALSLTHTWITQRLKYLSAAEVDQVLHFMELERTAIQRAVTHVDELGLIGICLFDGDRLLGFTLGERINSSVASVLIEKTDLEVLGCAQFLFREFAKCFDECEWINVGDDLGLENLKRVKMSYRPAMFGEKHCIKRYMPDDA